MKVYPAIRDATGLRLGVVVSRFNHLVSVRLLEGCLTEFRERGAKDEDVHVAWVPGAFEIPQAARRLAGTGRYAAVVTLGVVVQGETPHFDYVCRSVTDGVREAMRDTGVPIAFGVLTTGDVEQALVRASGPAGASSATESMSFTTFVPIDAIERSTNAP